VKDSGPGPMGKVQAEAARMLSPPVPGVQVAVVEIVETVNSGLARRAIAGRLSPFLGIHLDERARLRARLPEWVVR
jgi:hypothetical protein